MLPKAKNDSFADLIAQNSQPIRSHRNAGAKEKIGSGLTQKDSQEANRLMNGTRHS